MSDRRIRELIAKHNMHPHPEGGHYAEVFRSRHMVSPMDDRDERTALTTILFLLQKDEVSRFHMVESDEVWSHLEGDLIRQVTLANDLSELSVYDLAPSSKGNPLSIVPAGWWQASKSMGNYSLASCSVGPGFDFRDFQMASDTPAGHAIADKYPHLTKLI